MLPTTNQIRYANYLARRMKVDLPQDFTRQAYSDFILGVDKMDINAETATLCILINALHGTIIEKEKYKKGLISSSEYEEYLDAAARAIKRSTENANKILGEI